MAASPSFWKETLQEIGMWPEDRPAFMSRKQRAKATYDERGTRMSRGHQNPFQGGGAASIRYDLKPQRPRAARQTRRQARRAA